ncbi:NRDE family protein [Peribacillus asahii]|uniref:NRDE family protein n=1 Tax=Peribacillus asahii TaxID=228899 RepID=UPI002079B16A|nr:NRDE family protein [Peribacillus asahii]USK71427.1 NRDE family protein [Peribacillus asahii]
MCLINFAYKMDSRYDLVVAANRDEFYERPTAQASFWEDASHVLAGRDLEKMGTWMGVTKQGRFAALTNYRDPDNESGNMRSRGELVGQFLIGDSQPQQYVQMIQQHRDQYPGFNLIVGDGSSLYYYSNIENEIRLLKPGLYGLSNHLLDTPWPKVRKGKEGLERCLKGSTETLKDCLFSSLQYADPAPDEELPSTGVSLEWERKLSPLFIQTPDYGTRSSTVLFMTDKNVRFVERMFKEREYKEREFMFEIER